MCAFTDACMCLMPKMNFANSEIYYHVKQNDMLIELIHSQSRFFIRAFV